MIPFCVSFSFISSILTRTQNLFFITVAQEKGEDFRESQTKSLKISEKSPNNAIKEVMKMIEPNLESVTLQFEIYRMEGGSKVTRTLESFSTHIMEPYQRVKNDFGIEIESKIFYGEFELSVLRLNLEGKYSRLEKALESLFESYGLPAKIFKPNKIKNFKSCNTEKGVELAKDIVIKMGGKVKKPRFALKVEYLCSKKKK